LLTAASESFLPIDIVPSSPVALMAWEIATFAEALAFVSDTEAHSNMIPMNQRTDFA
jgi:hypothetical protein